TSAWASSRRRCLLQIYRSRGPTQTSPGKNTGCPAAPAPITAPTSAGFWASRLETRSPGRSGLLKGSLAFGAAVRLGLLLHTASRRQAWRLPTAVTACSCLQLAVATNSPRKGLSPPIQCPCLAHLRFAAREGRSAPGAGPSYGLSCPFSRFPDAKFHPALLSRLTSLMQACAVEGGH